MTQIILTGIKPSGTPHLGNYLGMFKPSLELMKRPNTQCFYFIADIHALNTIQDPKKMKQLSLEAAATWIALGLDPEVATLYRESDVPEISELYSYIAHTVPKSVMNMAHAYKAAIQENRENGREDLDEGVYMGLYNYPMLMAADILAFNTSIVPVGKDQTQHVEIARDIARRFNVRYGDILKFPQELVREEAAIIPGLDGRKMSKSYDNVIPLFLPEKQMQKLINQIKTDTSSPEDPKDPDTSSLFSLYKAFSTPDQTEEMRQKYLKGIGWGQVKKELFEIIQLFLAKPYSIYQELILNPQKIEDILASGAKKARSQAQITLENVRKALLG
ncbi:MAG: tryptophan--tRNA ligase [Parachlamydiales bacterium]|jgi:tryptophanyl-tRNA synthetase